MKWIVIFTVLGVALLYALSFLATAFLIWVVCWAFGFTFSWPLAIGVFAVLCILRSVFGGNGGGNG